MTLPFIYFGNPLIESLGPLLTETDIHKRMARTPALPTTKDIQRREVAMHQLQSVKDLYVVTP